MWVRWVVRICAGCNSEIGQARFLCCMGAVWHRECFHYHACNLPISEYEDLTFSKTLVPGPLFMEELTNEPTFSKELFGSAKRVYIACNEDPSIPVDFQHWMIEKYPVEEVKEIKGADHMPMVSNPQEVCKCLLDIAVTYS